MKRFHLPRLASRKPGKKLRATASRRAVRATTADYEELSEPNMRLSRALLIVLLLHVVAVSGILSPQPGTGRVEVRLERRIGRRWARVQRTRIKVRGGRFLTRIRFRRTGLYRVSVLTPGATQRRLLRVR